MEPSITLRILSHNRQKYLQKTLNSAFSQTEPFDCVELYDNGSNFSVDTLIRRHPELKVCGVFPAIPQMDNIRRAFSAPPETSWLCVFHDDDLLHPDFAKEMRATLREHPKVGAVSSNGDLMDEEGNLGGSLLPALKKDLVLHTPAEFARWYCEGFIPFPATVYRWSASFEAYLDFSRAYGRCADVAFLSCVLQQGEIILLEKKLFSYRHHREQDSAGFLWWEESKRWELQLELCQKDPLIRGYVEKKRRERLTSRWLNAWLQGRALEEAWKWDFVSWGALHRFFRNNKWAAFCRMLRRC